MPDFVPASEQTQNYIAEKGRICKLGTDHAVNPITKRNYHTDLYFVFTSNGSCRSRVGRSEVASPTAAPTTAISSRPSDADRIGLSALRDALAEYRKAQGGTRLPVDNA